MLGLRGRTRRPRPPRDHFPADYDAEFDDVFVRRRPARDPTLYVSAPSATDPGEAPAAAELVRARQRAGVGDVATGTPTRERARRPARRPRRIVARAGARPADLERETGAAGGAIYGAAPHGRLGTLRRPPNAVRGTEGCGSRAGPRTRAAGCRWWRSAARIVAEQIGPA